MTKGRLSRLRSRWTFGLVVSAALVTAGLLGCGTARQRYRVLSFLFDGVPDPDAPPPVEAEPEPRRSSAPRAEPAKQELASVHRPFAEERCEVCHGRSRRSARGGLSDVSGISAGWAKCKTCHSDDGRVGARAVVVRPESFQHGPVAKGKCRTCHEPHESRFLHLLRYERSEPACARCHSGLPSRAGPMASIDCATCHDPHLAAAETDLFLRGGARDHCARCHPLRTEERPWLHGPVSAAECSRCHDAHGSPGSVRHVRRPVAKVCLGCHEPESLPEDHAPSRGEECDTCHEPHAARSSADLFLKERIAKTLSGRSAFEDPPPGTDRGCGAPPVEEAARAEDRSGEPR